MTGRIKGYYQILVHEWFSNERDKKRHARNLSTRNRQHPRTSRFHSAPTTPRRSPLLLPLVRPSTQTHLTPTSQKLVQTFTTPHQILAYDRTRDSIALALGNKSLTVHNFSKPCDDWTVELNKPATVVCYQGNDILVADRSGDVYRCVPSQKPLLLLGHVSILTCMLTTPTRIITGDRDEKIRVSKFPNAYNIESFCLGHVS